MPPAHERSMKLTHMKSSAFQSGLQPTHGSDVRGSSLKRHFLVNKAVWKMDTGKTTQSIVLHLPPCAGQGFIYGSESSHYECMYTRTGTPSPSSSSTEDRPQGLPCTC